MDGFCLLIPIPELVKLADSHQEYRFPLPMVHADRTVMCPIATRGILFVAISSSCPHCPAMSAVVDWLPHQPSIINEGDCQAWDQSNKIPTQTTWVWSPQSHFTEGLWAHDPHLAHLCVVLTWKIMIRSYYNFAHRHDSSAAVACVNIMTWLNC